MSTNMNYPDSNITDSLSAAYFYGPLPSNETTLALYPYLLGKFFYDKYNVRSSTKHSDDLFLAVPLESSGYEITCTPDDLIEVDPALLHPLPLEAFRFRLMDVPHRGELAELLQESFLEFVLRHYKIRIFRNSEFGLYSRYSESKIHLMERCEEQMYYQCQDQVKPLQKKYQMLLDRLKNRYLHDYYSIHPESDGEQQSIIKSVFHQTRKMLTRLFTSPQESGTTNLFPELTRSDPAYEAVDDMRRLIHQARRELTNLLEPFRARIEDVEEYAISLNRGELLLHCVNLMWQLTEDKDLD